MVAPYATALAVMLDPEQATRNLRRLAGEGLEGAYGFYEAIDYTHGKTDEALSDGEAGRAPPRESSCGRSWPITRA